MKYSVSWLLLASLAMGSVYAAPIEVSGSIFLDAQFPFKPTDLPNNLYVSRARIDFKGQWSPTWLYKIRVDRPANYHEIDNAVALIPSAVVTWKLYDDKVKVNFGTDTPRYSQAGTDAQSYIERNLGVLEDSIGRKLGANISGVYNESYGYSLGIWSATARTSITDYSYSVIGIDSDIATTPAGDVSTVTNSATPVVTFGPHSIRPAIGGRINAIVLENKNFAWGTGLGVQSLDVIVPMISEYTDVNNSSTVYHNTFEKRIAMTVDQSFGWKKYTFNTAFHFFKYYRDVSASTDKELIPVGVNAYQRKNQASSGYVEFTGLVIGEGYKIDPACGVVNKIIPDEKYGSVEIALRVGREYYYNAAAAQFIKSSFSDNSAVPMTFSRQTGYNLVSLGANTDRDFLVRALGYTLSSSYVMNKNIAFKAEYYHIKTSSKANGIWTTLEKEQGLRVRSEYQFG